MKEHGYILNTNVDVRTANHVKLSVEQPMLSFNTLQGKAKYFQLVFQTCCTKLQDTAVDAFIAASMIVFNVLREEENGIHKTATSQFTFTSGKFLQQMHTLSYRGEKEKTQTIPVNF